MKSVAWKNTAHINNVPSELRTLMPKLIATYQDYYGQTLRAVYINGSAVRGEWKPGSDLDIVGFVSGDANPDDPKLAELLSGALQESSLPISHIDPFTITDAIRANPSPRIAYRLMIIALDGLRVWGEAIDLQTAVPSDPAEFCSRLYFDFKSASERYPLMVFDDSKAMQQRAKRVPKLVLRLANGIAVLKGAPFSSSYQTSLEHIRQWAPEWYDKAVQCYNMRTQAGTTAADRTLLLNTLTKLVVCAEKLGVTFAPTPKN